MTKKPQKLKKSIRFYVYLDEDGIPFGKSETLLRKPIPDEELPDDVFCVWFEIKRETWGEKLNARQAAASEVTAMGFGARDGKMTPQEEAEVAEYYAKAEVELVFRSLVAWDYPAIWLDGAPDEIPDGEPEIALLTYENLLKVRPSWIGDLITRAYNEINSAKNSQRG